MKRFHVRYSLHDGTRGSFEAIASSSCAAIVAARDAFGLLLRTCSARPA